MIRRWTAELLDTYLGWAVTPISSFFDFLIGPTTSTFTEYASRSSATAGLFEQLVTLGFLLLFIGVGVAGIYVLLDILSMLANPIISVVTGKEVTRTLRLKAAVAVYSGLQVGEFLLTQEFYLGELTDRIANDLAVVLAMFTGELPDAGVDITGFTWGLFGNPEIEFALVVGVLISGVSVLVWRFTTWSEKHVTIGLVVGVVGAFIYTSVAGIDIFPIPQPWGFLLQTMVLWLVIMTTIAWFLSQLIWMVLEWFPWVQYKPNRPRKLYMTFDGLVLLAMFPIFASNVVAVIGWISYKLFRHGGGETAVRILAGYDQECEVNPESEIRECHWMRGD